MITPPTSTGHLFVATKVRFNEFAGLSEEKGKAQDSIEFKSLGHDWSLRLYPGGCNKAAPGMVSLHLKNQTYQTKNIEIEFDFIVKKQNTKLPQSKLSRKGKFTEQDQM